MGARKKALDKLVQLLEKAAEPSEDDSFTMPDESAPQAEENLGKFFKEELARRTENGATADGHPRIKKWRKIVEKRGKS